MENFILWLISMEISNKNKLILVEKYGNEKEIFDNFEEIKRNYSRLFKKFERYNKYEELQKTNEILEKLMRLNASYITITMDNYPDKLRRLEEPPYFLFYIGNIDLINSKSIGVVGSRKNSLYGERSTKTLIKEIVKSKFTIISGGALGIDAIAHRSALENDGDTIAVLGSGIDVLYPSTNRKLLESICKQGLLLSEFKLGAKPLAFNFPRRNRIISALSDKVLVPEAKKGSGSIITVDHCLDIGVEVGAVPGSLFSTSGSGCNFLISEGATIIYDRDSLYEFLGVSADIKMLNEDTIEEKLLNVISDEPMHVDDIFAKTEVDRSTFYRLLFEMQIKNKIINLPGEFYVRVL